MLRGIAPLVGAALLGIGLAQTKPLARAQEAVKADAPAVAGAEKSKAEKAAAKARIAVFRLRGSVKEQAGEEGLSLSPSGGVVLRELIERLDKAAGDEHVKAVALVFDGASGGPEQIAEIRQAMERVKAAGKPVLVHADTVPGLGSYALLCGASRLSVSPTGELWVTGLYGEEMYLRGLLDKLHIRPDFMTCGEYKSAAELFMRHAPSKEADDMENWLLDGIYESLVGQIAAGRKADASKVKSWIDGGPYTAEAAIKNGMIDAIESRQDFEAHLKRTHGEDIVLDLKYGKKVEPKPDFSSPLGMMRSLSELLGPPKKPAARKPAVAVVYVEGPIVAGFESASLFAGRVATSSALRKALNEAADDDSIKAVVLRVDSPGGSALGSEIILDATRRVKAKKPFTVSMGNIAGSGGYYVACAADTIFAGEGTITASIGVVSGKLATNGLFDTLGVRFKPYKRGENAGMLASGEVFTPSERKRMKAYMDEVYETFKGHVVAIRGDRLKQPIDELAGGRVFTGKQALERGLIDRLGTLDDAIKHVAALAKVTDYEVRVLPRPKSFLEVLLSDSTEEDEPKYGLDVKQGGAVGAVPPPASIVDLALPLLGQLDPARASAVRQALGHLELIRREGVIMAMPQVPIAWDRPQ